MFVAYHPRSSKPNDYCLLIGSLRFFDHDFCVCHPEYSSPQPPAAVCRRASSGKHCVFLLQSIIEARLRLDTHTKISIDTFGRIGRATRYSTAQGLRHSAMTLS